jgi:hypothetical protein
MDYKVFNNNLEIWDISPDGLKEIQENYFGDFEFISYNQMENKIRIKIVNIELKNFLINKPSYEIYEILKKFKNTTCKFSVI